MLARVTQQPDSHEPMSFIIGLLTDDEKRLLGAMDASKTSEDLAGLLLSDALPDQGE